MWNWTTEPPRPPAARFSSLAMALFFSLFTGEVLGAANFTSPTAAPSRNFSTATAAAAFVGMNNLTFISCENFADQRDANVACASRLGHTRGQCCLSSVYGNASRVSICRCIPYAGMTPPGNCMDASCVWGAEACSVRQGANYFAIVVLSFSLVLTAYVLGFGVYVIVVGRKHLQMNSLAVTLVSITIASFFHVVWRFCNFLGYAVLLSAWPGTNVQQPVCIPGVACFGTVGLLAFPLQWLKVAHKATRIKTRGKVSAKPHIAVATAAFVIGAVFLVLATQEMSEIASALAGVIFFISTIIYTVGYYKLTGAIGKGNQSVRVIGLLARNIAICLVFTLLSSLSFTVINPFGQADPSGLSVIVIFILDFAIPTSYASLMLLLLRFSFSSLAATKQRKIKTSASSTTVPVGAVGGNLYTVEDDMADNDRKRRYSANVCNPMLEGKSFETKSQDKSKSPNSRRRQSTMVVLAQKRKNTIDSIEAVSNIVNMILVPMVIVPFLDYQTLGKIPRSNTAKPGSGDGATAKMGSPNSISQPHGEGWTVVFVSHRWWGGNHPDDEVRNLKYGIICRGIEALIKRDNLDPERVGIWMDYACIEQDDGEELQKGVDSLIGYAAQSNYFLIPVFPDTEAVKAFVQATHPMELVNYGNRAWCRLEVYVFSCLVEIMGREITCFAYGLHVRSIKAGENISEELMATGKSRRGAASSFCGSCTRYFGGSSNKEKLKPLFGHKNGALFAKTYMPSSGDLTVEDDREVVRGIETIIQRSYSTTAIKKEVERLRQQGSLAKKQSSTPTSQFSPLRALKFTSSVSKMKSTVNGSEELTEDGNDRRVCGLASKQIHDGDIDVLTKSLGGEGMSDSGVPPRQIRKLVLRDNMITDAGVKALLRDYVTKHEGGRQVKIIDLGGNPIGPAGAMLFSRLLANGGGTCVLSELSLASTGLDAAGIMGIASWLGTASQLSELNLCGNGEFGAEAMLSLVVAMEQQGHVVVKMDDAATVGLPRGLVAHVDRVNKSNMATSYLNLVPVISGSVRDLV